MAHAWSARFAHTLNYCHVLKDNLTLFIDTRSTQSLRARDYLARPILIFSAILI